MPTQTSALRHANLPTGENHMSKRLVALQNHTDLPVALSPRASGKLYYFQQRFQKGRTAVEVDVPDNSDSSHYFETNHIEVQILDKQQKFALGTLSFWDDDYKDYKIYYCEGDSVPQPSAITPMRGGDKGGNRAKVVLHVFEYPAGSGKYDLATVRVTTDGIRKEIASGFKEFADTVGMKANVKHTPEAIHQFMQHKAFRPLLEKSLEGGYQSIAIVSGGGASLGVGAEVSHGVLTDREHHTYYEMKSTALTLGAEEGVVAFTGLYLSDEPASKVGGLEFFEEVAIGLEVGISLRRFTTFSSGSGLLFLFTTGEELELSIGLGETTTSKIS
jgi:hypothetical protein